MDLREQLGDIDIYLLDQLMKGHFRKEMAILDAGCGHGRNLVYMLRNGFDVYAIDQSEEAVRSVRSLAAELAPDWPTDRARVEAVERMSFADGSFDGVVCNAVLHFARDHAHMEAMLRELWRVLRPGGKLFARLASSIGLESQVKPLGEGRYKIPDGSTRYLVDEPFLLRTAEELGGQLYEPIKTVLVAGQRSMTTWCIRKPEVKP